MNKVGKSEIRVDGYDKVTGRTKYYEDRMPREAAMCGCCVITGRRGSAAYAEDVGIPEEYRFFEETCEKEEIQQAIRRCLSDYDREQERFETYRETIRSEKVVFRECVEKLFFMTDTGK